MKLNVINSVDGKAKSEIEVSDAAFGAKFNRALVHQVVVAYQANGRQGTRAQKTRAEVNHSTRKPWSQKGGGRARAGMTSSPLWRGGGKAFPASPDENFSQKVNKKMYRAALRSILSELVRQQRLLAVDSFAVDGAKTKALVQRLGKLNAPQALIVTEEADDKLSLSARNLYRVDVCDVASIDPVSLVAFEKVIMTAGALKRLEEKLA